MLLQENNQQWGDVWFPHENSTALWNKAVIILK